MPGVGAGWDEVEKHCHFQPEEEANTFCLGQRCPRAFSALPSTKELHWGVKEQPLFQAGHGHSKFGAFKEVSGGSRRVITSLGEIYGQL